MNNDSSTCSYKWSELALDINIRIYHECEGRIEKSILRIAIWHHKAC